MGSSHSRSRRQDADSTPSGTKITSFPLPAELRYEILKYLLRPDHVEYDPRDPATTRCHSKAYYKTGGTAHSYKLETGILGVNRAIGTEAARYMHSHGTYILITYKCPGFAAMLHRMDVPIIADRNATLANHAFAIHLHWALNPFDSIWCTGRAKMKAPKRGAVLMLTRDLPKLQALLRLHCAFLAPNRVCVVEGSPLMTTKGRLSKYLPELTLTARTDQALYKRPSDAQLLEFLHGFEDITGIGYKLKLVGFMQYSDRQLAMKQTLAPKLIWPRAQIWDRFDVAQQFKQEADNLALKGDYEAARARYEFIGCWSECDCFYTLKKVDTSRDSALLAGQERWLILNFDCCVSQSWLQLRLQPEDARYPRCGYRLTEILSKLEGLWGGSRSTALDSTWSHVVLLAVAAMLCKSKRTTARFSQMATDLIQVCHLSAL